MCTSYCLLFWAASLKVYEPHCVTEGEKVVHILPRIREALWHGTSWWLSHPICPRHLSGQNEWSRVEGALSERLSFKQTEHPQPLTQDGHSGISTSDSGFAGLAGEKDKVCWRQMLPLVMTVLPPGNKHNSSSLTGIRAWPLMSRA